MIIKKSFKEFYMLIENCHYLTITEAEKFVLMGNYDIKPSIVVTEDSYPDFYICFTYADPEQEKLFEFPCCICTQRDTKSPRLFKSMASALPVLNRLNLLNYAKGTKLPRSLELVIESYNHE